MRDVALDLAALARVEVAFADRENLRFLRVQEQAAVAADVLEVARRQLLQVLEVAFRQHGRLVRLRDDREVLLQPPISSCDSRSTPALNSSKPSRPFLSR